MFAMICTELKELIELTRDIATREATLLANPKIEPAESYYENMARKRSRRNDLLKKYELL